MTDKNEIETSKDANRESGILNLANNSVKIEQKTKEILAHLPQRNCGKCGYINCSLFAEIVVRGEISPCNCCRLSRESLELILQIVQNYDTRK